MVHMIKYSTQTLLPVSISSIRFRYIVIFDTRVLKRKSNLENNKKKRSSNCPVFFLNFNLNFNNYIRSKKKIDKKCVIPIFFWNNIFSAPGVFIIDVMCSICKKDTFCHSFIRLIDWNINVY